MDQHEEDKLNTALKGVHGYVTLKHLVEITGLPEAVVREFVLQRTEKVRTSRMTLDSGEPLYTTNTPLSGIADAWATFRYTNAKKF